MAWSMIREARPAVYLPKGRLEDHCDRLLECGVGVNNYSDQVVAAGRTLVRLYTNLSGHVPTYVRTVATQ